MRTPHSPSFSVAALAMMLLTAAILIGCVTAKGTSPADKIAYIKAMRDETLTELAASKPETRALRNDMPGYAVFDSVGIKILTLGSGNGYGVVVDNKTGHETYMKVAQLSVGLGLGVKKMRTVVFFRTREAMEYMITEGWSAGAQATAAAKANDQGGAAGGRESVERNCVIYQLTDSGIELTASIGGTKVWKDDELN